MVEFGQAMIDKGAALILKSKGLINEDNHPDCETYLKTQFGITPEEINTVTG